MNKRRIQNVGLLLGVLLLLVAGLEVAVRIWRPVDQWVEVERLDPNPDRLGLMNKLADWLLPQTEGLYQSAGHGWRMTPMRRLTITDAGTGTQLYTIVTNTHGLRNPELSPQERPRILFLGDSVTFGLGVPEPQVFVRRIEELAEQAGRPVETVNAGVSGNNVAAYVPMFNELKELVQPDVVVVSVVLNDMTFCCTVQMIRPPRLLRNSMAARQFFDQLSFQRAVDPNADDFFGIPRATYASWVQQLQHDFPIGQGDPLKDDRAFNRVLNENKWNYGLAWSAPAWKPLAADLAALATSVEAQGAALAVVVFPIELQVKAEMLRDFPQRQLAEITKELNLPLLDLLSAFRAEQQAVPSKSLFSDGLHLSVHGNAVAARHIWRFLRPIVPGEPG